MGITPIEDKVLRHLILCHDDGKKFVQVCDLIGGSYHTHGLVLSIYEWPKVLSALSNEKRLIRIEGRKPSRGSDTRKVRICAAGRIAVRAKS